MADREMDLEGIVAWLRVKASTGVNPERIEAEPIRVGTALPECAGGLAYFSFGTWGIGPARTFEEALQSAISSAPTGKLDE